MVCMGCAVIAFLVKSAIFWWCVVLRATQEGKVASGKMVMECEAKYGSSVVEQVATGAVAGDSTRLLDDTITLPEQITEMIEEAIAGVPVCNDMDAFQTKGGKFMLAWIIISALKCV